jgi:hypothetical protein
MGAKDVEKRGSRSARSSRLGKRSKAKEKNGSAKAGALSSNAIKEGKGSDPKDKSALTTGDAAKDKATESPHTATGHVPNAETAKVLREAREGKNLLNYGSLEEMFDDLGI